MSNPYLSKHSTLAEEPQVQSPKPVLPNIRNKADGLIKGAIRNFSIIAVVIVFFVVTISAIGAEFRLDISNASVQFLGLLMASSNIFLYELWRSNGKKNGMTDKGFLEALSRYANDVKLLDLPAMEQYLNYERHRRKGLIESLLAEESGLSIDELATLSKQALKSKGIRLFMRLRIIRYRKRRLPKLAFKTAWQIKWLSRYVSSGVDRETTSSSERNDVVKNTLIKYSTAVVFMLVTVSAVFSLIGANPLQVLFTVAMFSISMIFSVVGGHGVGNRQIAVHRKNILLTACDYMSECDKYIGSLELIQLETSADNNTETVAE